MVLFKKETLLTGLKYSLKYFLRCSGPHSEYPAGGKDNAVFIDTNSDSSVSIRKLKSLGVTLCAFCIRCIISIRVPKGISPQCACMSRHDLHCDGEYPSVFQCSRLYPFMGFKGIFSYPFDRTRSMFALSVVFFSNRSSIDSSSNGPPIQQSRVHLRSLYIQHFKYIYEKVATPSFWSHRRP